MRSKLHQAKYLRMTVDSMAEHSTKISPDVIVEIGSWSDWNANGD